MIQRNDKGAVDAHEAILWEQLFHIFHGSKREQGMIFGLKMHFHIVLIRFNMGDIFENHLDQLVLYLQKNIVRWSR